MWNLKVPKIMHTYWGGDILPYIRLLTIKSFIKYNPEWEIWLWTAKQSIEKITWASRENDYKLVCNNFLPTLLNMPIKIIPTDFKRDELTSKMAEVHRADYVRINCMCDYGGLWSDMDILYFKSIDNLSVNSIENKNKEVFVNICNYGHSSGFMLSQKDSYFFQKLKESIPSNFNPTHYQCIGPIMFNKYFPTLSSIPNSVNIPMDAVYKYDFNHVKNLLEDKTDKFNDNSIGCHWYGGNTLWEDFIRQTNGGLMNLSDNIISNLIRNAVSI